MFLSKKNQKNLPVPFIDLSSQQKQIQKEVDSALKAIFSSQKFILGAYGHQLEEQVAKKIGAKYAIGVANGSDALYLALLAVGVSAGDEVITTPFSFFATAGAISRIGAFPRFVDIDPLTFNLDPKKIDAKISKKTKAILPVHLFGLPADMPSILAVANRYNLPVIEDAAQSFGATLGGKQTGNFGDVGCFSFYPTKNLGGAGDGGIMTTSSPEIADRLKLLRNHGSKEKYRHEIVGINSRLDEIQAAVILAKLKHIDGWNASREKIAKIYEKGFKSLPVTLPTAPRGTVSTHHLYSILSDKREALLRHLEGRGIGAGVYYPLPLHLQPCYERLKYKVGDFPVSEATAKKILSLPLFAGMTDKQAQSVVAAMQEFFKT